MKRLHVRLGIERLRKPKYASEPGFLRDVQKMTKTLEEELEYIFDQFEDVTPDIVYDAMEPTFEKSKVYCPKNTGALVNSGYLEVTQRGKSPYVEIGYGKGGKPRYTPYVHEMTGQYHEHPTRSKWLEAAVNEDLFDIFDRVTEGYRVFMNA